MRFSPSRLLAAAALSALPLLACAQFTGNVSLTSDYKFRGQDQDTSRTRAVKPALQGGFDYVFGDSGWYVGNWNSSVDWLPRNSLESDLYGGYKFKAGDADIDLGALAYVYGGDRNGNTTELYGAATLGAFTAKYSHTVSQDYFGFAGARSGSGLSGRDTGYLNLGWTQAVNERISIKASLGFTHFSSGIRSLGVPDYVDYNLGGSYDLGGGASVALALAGADQRGFFGAVNQPRLIATLGKTL